MPPKFKIGQRVKATGLASFEFGRVWGIVVLNVGEYRYIVNGKEYSIHGIEKPTDEEYDTYFAS